MSAPKSFAALEAVAVREVIAWAMTFDLELGAYKEDEDFLCRGDPEPHLRSQNAIFHSDGYKWHIKITFRGRILREKVAEAFLKVQKQRAVRRQQLQTFISFIKFECLPLLGNTVTEVEFRPMSRAKRRLRTDSKILPVRGTISDLSAENGYKQFSSNFDYQIREDPSRVFYPPLKNVWVPTTSFPNIKLIEEVAPGVSRVSIISDTEERNYIFKSIDKPLYEPRDSEILAQELQNLQLFHHSPYIVQLVSAVSSANPYDTGKSDDHSSVLRGILLRYHPGGTLKEALTQTCAHPRWRKWPIQIARGLQQLHHKKIAHMDLKPSNIVINTIDDAVIIDISGAAVTYEWMAPEMREADDPASLPWEARRCNDIWALGKLLSMMLRLESDEEKIRLLHGVIEGTTKKQPNLRTKLNVVIIQLEQILN